MFVPGSSLQTTLSHFQTWQQTDPFASGPLPTLLTAPRVPLPTFLNPQVSRAAQSARSFGTTSLFLLGLTTTVCKEKRVRKGLQEDPHPCSGPLPTFSRESYKSSEYSYAKAFGIQF